MLFTVFTALMLLEVHGEDQKKSNALVSYKTQKTKFGPHFLQKPRARFFTKIILFKLLYLHANTHKKSMHIFFKNPGQDFSQKLFCSILSLYAAVSSCKYSQKIHADFLLEKPHFGPICPKCFPKNFFF